MKIILSLSALLALLLLPVRPAVAAASDPNVLNVSGRGTLTLSSSAAVSYQDYFHSACPLVLAAHESGRWVAQMTGPDETCNTSGVDFRRYIYATLANCEGGERYGECWIVALGRNIVWNGEIRARNGKWTPRTSRQFSVVLSGKPTGHGVVHAVGLATYRAKGGIADLTFARHSQFGSCSGALTMTQGQPWPFHVKCTKAGEVTGLFTVSDDGHTGSGIGSSQGGASGKGAHDYDLTLLPHWKALAKAK
jgi:hypothetical protein